MNADIKDSKILLQLETDFLAQAAKFVLLISRIVQRELLIFVKIVQNTSRTPGLDMSAIFVILGPFDISQAI
jgi:hypothetical protein